MATTSQQTLATNIDLKLVPMTSKQQIGKSVFVATVDGQLKQYSYPEFELAGTYKLPQTIYRAAFDARRGLFGAWLTDLGITSHPPAFFGGIPGTLFTLVGIHVWKTFPLLAIMFVVALQYLPQETLHAARIDGASMLKRFRYVVLPHLRPTIVAAVIIELLITLQLFDLIYALTLGGPGAYSTYNLYFYAYKNTFEYTDFGYGAVLAYVVSALVIGFALILTRGRSARSQLAGG